MGKRFELLISDAEARGSGSHGELALIAAQIGMRSVQRLDVI